MPLEKTKQAAVRDATFSLCVAISAAAVVLVFFCPSFVTWEGLGFPELDPRPEFGRARVTLAQLDDPFGPVIDPANRAIGWRLLFPVVWYFLRLPSSLFLVMPFVGCALALWLTAWLAHDRLQSWLGAWLTTTLFATLPWFFVSTGWLAYFDSWFVLGLLAVAFVPSRVALAAAWLLVPWIDERFIIAMPVSLATRAVALRKSKGDGIQSLLVDVATSLLALAPYAIIRLGAWFFGDPASSAYVRAHWSEVQLVPWPRFVIGLWSGYRAGWLMITAALLLGARKWGWRRALIFGLMVLATALGALLIAADMSRSLMMISPVLLLGVWLCGENPNGRWHWLLPSVVVANLLLPASHETWWCPMPIRSLRAELANNRDKPRWLSAPPYFREGNELLAQGKLAEARDAFSQAIERDDEWIAARVQRAVTNAKLGEPGLANVEIELVLSRTPRHCDARFMHAVLQTWQGHPEAAIEDLRIALEAAPEAWPQRQEAEAALAQLLAAEPEQPAHP